MNAKILRTPIGPLTLEASEVGLTHVHFGEVRVDGDARTRAREVILERAEVQLEEYFAGTRVEFTVPLDPEGTPFQREVWEALRSIPFGETTSYGEVARRIERPRAVRAVGAANGANPIPIIVPCHRVIGADRSLTGFAGGLHVKCALLRLEGLTVEDSDAARPRLALRIDPCG